MTVIKKDIIKDVFNYIKKHGIYEDKEDYIISGKEISNEELRLQEFMEQFAFEMLEKCVKLDKYYNDKNDIFENYTIYLEHDKVEIFVYILYGQGNYFYISKRDEFYRNDLLVRV